MSERENPVDARPILKRMEVTTRELADQTGLSPGTITKVISGRNASKRSRALIEAAIGEPIWCTWEEFVDRGQVAAIIGGEPEAMTVKQLAYRAKHGRPDLAKVWRLVEIAAAAGDKRSKAFIKLKHRTKKKMLGGVKYDPARRTKAKLIEDIVDVARRARNREEDAEVTCDAISGRPTQRCRRCGRSFPIPKVEAGVHQVSIRADSLKEKCIYCGSRRVVVVDGLGKEHLLRDRKPRAKAMQEALQQAAEVPQS
jgi:hypothetical protein